MISRFRTFIAGFLVLLPLAVTYAIYGFHYRKTFREHLR